jgi:hypothetical protein
MQIIAEEAAKRGQREYGVNLDFSPESIERLEEILGKIHDAHLKTPLSEKELSLLSLRWGAYIGESLKRVRPGKWERDSKELGAGRMPLVYATGEQAFPYSWVYKRIADGPFDNVASKFRIFSDPSILESAESASEESPQS